MPPRFPPRVPREHINNLPPMNQDDLDAARKEFPEEKLPSRALEKYAKKHWIEGRYFWKDNFRYVCGSDIQYFTATIPRYERKTDPQRRTYHVAKITPTLAMIDRPKKKGLQKLVAHQSESEWALPQNHDRHLLKFPQEIIDMISRSILTIEDHTIMPDVTTSDWARVFKPFESFEPHFFAVHDAIRLIENSGTPVLEDCWGAYSYHDHFFRFLQAIGKEKAGMLKTLKFSGTVILHVCEGNGPTHGPNGLKESLCSKDLVDTLRLYVPIINRFCTGLEKLVIEVKKDPHTDWSLLLVLDPLNSGRSVHQQYITSLLEGELRKLKTVKILEIYKVFEVKDDASAADPPVDTPERKEFMKREKLDFAEPTIEWFRDRASKSGNQKRGK
ncbi:hypothetical protein BOTNAR_0034g00420 [Botryotinia narcissicola]|uniref:Uncharacterized protein n=1 Tax=Botryotinia narcissicola TaxID=278944 RepID=A0A4Z1J8U4_9HELO|nr:hypothetical protein BOTNAR_0034g00420 [Botryotinia narcissicola]